MSLYYSLRRLIECFQENCGPIESGRKSLVISPLPSLQKRGIIDKEELTGIF
jgi:hypothetical protein